MTRAARPPTDVVQLDLGLLLPSVEAEADPCLTRLRSTLDGRAWVERVHLTRDDGTARLCVHFDPDRLSVARVEALARAAGLGLEAQYTHLSLSLDDLTHERQARSLAIRAASIEGVLFARASASGKRMHLELQPGADRRQVDRALAALGIPTGAARHEHGPHTGDDESGPVGERHHGDHERDHGAGDHAHGGSNLEVGFALVAGALTLFGWLLESYISGAVVGRPGHKHHRVRIRRLLRASRSVRSLAGQTTRDRLPHARRRGGCGVAWRMGGGRPTALSFRARARSRGLRDGARSGRHRRARRTRSEGRDGAPG